MPHDFLHDHRQFADLIRIVAEAQGIAPALVEKDYWIMQSLYGLQQLGLTFELKGGTSLSKGYGLISRFSEDIDIRIEPPADPPVMIGRNHDKAAHVQSRKDFYDRLAQTIVIDGITSVERDTAFDDPRQYRSAGIRLTYASINGSVEGLKDGVLLEVGFDDVAPNEARDISSWAYDFAASQVEIIDNRALGVACYHPGHTLVEKLQAISTKFRQQQETGAFPPNFMRHYYDVYSLLQDPTVQAFVGTQGISTTRPSGSRSSTIRSSPRTRPSYSATQRPGPRCRRPTLPRARSISAASRPLTTSWPQSPSGRPSCKSVASRHHQAGTIASPRTKALSDAMVARRSAATSMLAIVSRSSASATLRR